MIIKPMDSLKTKKLELDILSQFHLPAEKSYLVEQEKKRLYAGEKGEKNTAYLLDFLLDDAKNWALIHDLRIKYKNKVAQIDHLIITRALDIYVLETKAYGDKLHILDDGSFIASYGKKEFAIPSPIEQNKRHIYILEKLLTPLLPKRLGITLQPHIDSYVLIDENTILKRSKKFDSSCVIKAEQFLSILDNKYETLNVGALLTKATKLISRQSLKTLAAEIAKLHCKTSTNYKERFGITDEDLSNRPTNTSGNQKAYKTGNFCAQCKVNIPPNVAKFCFDQKHRFGGRAYCYNCQKNY